MVERVVLHVDMDAFFASVEQRRRPELKGRPVVVGGRGDPTQRGVVAAASYEARKYGIHSAMPLREAYRRCPEAVFLPVDYASYSEISSRIKEILNDISHLVEDVGLDEAFLDVSHLERPPERLAEEIKRRIGSRTGLTCSVGIGPNKLLAKIASGLEKPEGLTRLSRSDVERRVWPLSVRRIWGVGPKTEAALAKLGVSTIGELAKAPVDKLTAHLGAAHGRSLHDAANGVDESPVVPHRRRKSISREATFPSDVGDRHVLLGILGRLAEDVAGQLRRHGLLAGTVGVKLRFSDFVTLTRQITLEEPTDEAGRIGRAALHCFERIPLARKLRLVGVRASRLEPGPAARELLPEA